MGKNRAVQLSWNSSYAGNAPLKSYEIWRDNLKIASVDHKPQVSETPFIYSDLLKDNSAHQYKLVAVDSMNRKAESENLLVNSLN